MSATYYPIDSRRGDSSVLIDGLEVANLQLPFLETPNIFRNFLKNVVIFLVYKIDVHTFRDKRSPSRMVADSLAV